MPDLIPETVLPADWASLASRLSPLAEDQMGVLTEEPALEPGHYVAVTSKLGRTVASGYVHSTDNGVVTVRLDGHGVDQLGSFPKELYRFYKIDKEESDTLGESRNRWTGREGKKFDVGSVVVQVDARGNEIGPRGSVLGVDGKNLLIGKSGHNPAKYKISDAKMLRVEDNLDESKKSKNRDLYKKIMAKNSNGPAIDKSKYPPIKGMEGPFKFKKSGILYYDPKEGRYYDSKTDIYLDVNDLPEDDDDLEGVEFTEAADVNPTVNLGSTVADNPDNSPTTGALPAKPDAKPPMHEAMQVIYPFTGNDIRWTAEIWDDIQHFGFYRAMARHSLPGMSQQVIEQQLVAKKLAHLGGPSPEWVSAVGDRQ